MNCQCRLQKRCRPTNNYVNFAGACAGRSGQVPGEASRWSGIGGSWDTHTDHCTQDFHTVSPLIFTASCNIEHVMWMPVPVSL